MKWERDFNWVGHSEILCCIDLGIKHGCRHILASAVVTLEVLVSHLMRYYTCVVSYRNSWREPS